MTKLIDSLDGSKMYIGCAIGAVVVLVNHFWIPIAGLDLDSNNWLFDLYTLAMIATGRSAAKKFEAPPK